MSQNNDLISWNNEIHFQNNDLVWYLIFIDYSHYSEKVKVKAKVNFKREESPQAPHSKEFTSGYAVGRWDFRRLRVWMRQTWNDDAGIFCAPLHGLIGSVWHGVQVRGVLVQLPASVGSDGLFAVDVHLPIRVNGDHHLSDVGVDAALFEPTQTTGDILLFTFFHWLIQTYTAAITSPHIHIDRPTFAFRCCH